MITLTSLPLYKNLTGDVDVNEENSDDTSTLICMKVDIKTYERGFKSLKKRSDVEEYI